jgi:hypothetical protein
MYDVSHFSHHQNSDYTHSKRLQQMAKGKKEVGSKVTEAGVVLQVATMMIRER